MAKELAFLAQRMKPGPGVAQLQVSVGGLFERSVLLGAIGIQPALASSLSSSSRPRGCSEGEFTPLHRVGDPMKGTDFPARAKRCTGD